MREKPIAVTTGEPAGIGPEVALKAAVAADYPIVLLGDRALLDATRKKLGLPTLPANVAVEDVPLSVPAVPGQLDVRNSAYVVKLLERGCDGALAGDFGIREPIVGFEGAVKNREGFIKALARNGGGKLLDGKVRRDERHLERIVGFA